MEEPPTELDSSELDYPERRRRDAARQQAIRDILPHSAGAPLDDIRALLRRALADRGVGPQPESWVDAVASDAAMGHIYVVSRQAMDDTGDVLEKT